MGPPLPAMLMAIRLSELWPIDPFPKLSICSSCVRGLEKALTFQVDELNYFGLLGIFANLPRECLKVFSNGLLWRAAEGHPALGGPSPILRPRGGRRFPKRELSRLDPPYTTAHHGRCQIDPNRMTLCTGLSFSERLRKLWPFRASWGIMHTKWTSVAVAV